MKTNIIPQCRKIQWSVHGRTNHNVDTSEKSTEHKYQEKMQSRIQLEIS